MRILTTLAFIGLTTLAAADAHAGFTHVNAPVHSTELGHAQILGQAYGGTFNASGVNYGNGTLTAQRLSDTAGPGSDECWGEAFVSARAIARFAGSEQSFGYVDGASGAGTFQNLFTVTGWGTSVGGNTFELDLCSNPVRFARGNGNTDGGDQMFSSLAADNVLGADQMVAYQLLGGSGPARYVLFFEDVGANLDSDWDFNDLVVEVTVRPGANAVPLPPAAGSGLAALIAGGLVTGRRRLAGLFC
jgi:hypothetical protein